MCGWQSISSEFKSGNDLSATEVRKRGESIGENGRHWIGECDAHIQVDMGVAQRLQIVVPVWVCQFHLRRLDGHRRPRQ